MISKEDKKDVKDHYAKEAVNFINYGNQRRNVLTVCELVTQPDHLPLQVYMLYTSRLYSFVVHAVIILHCFLQFF